MGWDIFAKVFSAGAKGVGETMSGVAGLSGSNVAAYRAQTERGYLQLAEQEAEKLDQWVGNYTNTLGKTNLDSYKWAGSFTKAMRDYWEGGVMPEPLKNVATQATSQVRQAGAADIEKAKGTLAETLSEKGVSKESGAYAKAQAQMATDVATNVNALANQTKLATEEKLMGYAENKLEQAKTDPAFQDFYIDENGNYVTSRPALSIDEGTYKNIRAMYGGEHPDVARHKVLETYGFKNQMYDSSTKEGWLYNPQDATYAYYRNGAPVAVDEKTASHLYSASGVKYAVPERYQAVLPGGSYYPGITTQSSGPYEGVWPSYGGGYTPLSQSTGTSVPRATAKMATPTNALRTTPSTSPSSSMSMAKTSPYSPDYIQDRLSRFYQPVENVTNKLRKYYA